MHYNYAVFLSCLFALGALASPQPGFLERGIASGYSPHDAGAILSKGGKTFQANEATFKIPSVRCTVGSVLGAWVGLDGFTCHRAGVAAGVEMTIENNEVSYAVKARFSPGELMTYPMTVQAGDNITVRVTASESGTSATVVVMNASNGQQISEELNSTTALCGQDAAWFMDMSPVVDFNEVTFEGATASGPNGSYHPGDGASILDVVQNGRYLTSVAISNSTVDIEYV